MQLSVNRLPVLIDSVATRHFYPNLLAFLAGYFSFDRAIIFLFEREQPPLCLLKTESHEDDDINLLYQGGAYLQDPFYQAFDSAHEMRVHTLHQLVPLGFRHSRYYQDFYHKTGWQDEAGILLRLSADQALGLFLGSIRQPVCQPMEDPASLMTFLCVLKSLVKLHGDCLAPRPVHQDSQMTDVLAGLTLREQEIVSLILAGKSSQEIAERSYISLGTVKNHRKNIYSKLNIRSQAELFNRCMVVPRHRPVICCDGRHDEG